jgi:hypothetical protein
MDIHQSMNSDVEDSRPSRKLAEAVLEEDMSELSEDMGELVEEEEKEEEESAPQRTSTRFQWKAWEDPAVMEWASFFRMMLAHCATPYQVKIGKPTFGEYFRMLNI